MPEGICCDEGPWFPLRFNAFKELLFDVQALNDDFDDPVTFGNSLQVIVKVAHRDAVRKSLGVNGGRVAVQSSFQVTLCDGISGSIR